MKYFTQQSWIRHVIKTFANISKRQRCVTQMTLWWSTPFSRELFAFHVQCCYVTVNKISNTFNCTNATHIYFSENYTSVSVKCITTLWISHHTNCGSFSTINTVMENDALTLLNHIAANNDMFNAWKYWVCLAFLKYRSTKPPSIQYG